MPATPRRPSPERTGPRERLAAAGPAALSDEELVALVLGTGSAREPVPVLAARLLSATRGLAGLEHSGVGTLASLPGIGTGKASRLLAAIELGRRVNATPLWRGRPILSSRDVDAALRPRLGRAQEEHFLALPLDARNRPTGEIRVAVGGLSACPVAPADVFRALVREAAAGVIFVHNHPSGEPTPSRDDLAITVLCQAGQLLGVRVLDHVILAHDSYFSFLDEGLFERSEEEDAA